MTALADVGYTSVALFMEQLAADSSHFERRDCSSQSTRRSKVWRLHAKLKRFVEQTAACRNNASMIAGLERRSTTRSKMSVARELFRP